MSAFPHLPPPGSSEATVTRRLLALLCLLALVVGTAAACSDDSGGDSSDDSTPDEEASGDDEGGGDGDICTLADENLALIEGESDDLPTEEQVAALQEIADAADEEVQDDFQVVVDAYEEVATADDTDFDALFDTFFDPEFIGAIEQVGLYLEDECGLDIETPSEGSGDGGDEEADDGFGPDGLRAYLTEEDPDLEERIQSIVTVQGSDLTVGVRELADADEAIEICETLSGYAYGEDGSSSVTVNVQGTDSTTVATRDGEDGTCEAA